MEVLNTISLEELNIIYNNKKKYYKENASKLSSLDVAYDLIKKDRGFVSSNSASAPAPASNAPAGSSAAASAASNAALKEEMEHVMRLLRGEAPPQSKKQEKTSNFYSAFSGQKQAQGTAKQGTAKQENRQNQSSNKTKKEKEAFALFETTEENLRKLNTEIAKKEITKKLEIQNKRGKT